MKDRSVNSEGGEIETWDKSQREYQGILGCEAEGDCPYDSGPEGIETPQFEHC